MTRPRPLQLRATFYRSRIPNCRVGIYSRYKENASIRELVEAHPEWSEERALAELNRAGARFGPEKKDELLKTVRLEKYERFIGHFTIKSVEFAALSEPHEGNFAFLWWRIKLDVELSGGSHTEYSLIFEPFEGKLTQVLHGLTGVINESTGGN